MIKALEWGIGTKPDNSFNYQGIAVNGSSVYITDMEKHRIQVFDVKE